MRECYPELCAVDFFSEENAKRASNSFLPTRHVKKAMRHGLAEEMKPKAREISQTFGKGAIHVLLGRRGIGKTHLASCLAMTVLSAGRSVFYSTAFELFNLIKRTFDGQGDIYEVLELYLVPSLVVIDEIQERSESRWESLILTHILDHRYSHEKDTMLIGNLSPEAFSETISPSVISRIEEDGNIHVCSWDYKRAKAGSS